MSFDGCMVKQTMVRSMAYYLIKWNSEFPGGPVVKNPSSNAGDVSSIPRQGTKIPHAVGQLSLHTLEPAQHN